MSRDISEVIDAVLLHVPVEETGLRASLAGVKARAAYMAPEQVAVAWTMAHQALIVAEVIPPSEAWHRHAANIFAGREGP